jgi:hypothetical protein
MTLQKAKSARKVKKGKAKSQALVAQPWLEGCTVQKFAGCDVASHFRNAQHRCGESVMMNSEGGTSPWWHWLLDLKRIYFAPDLVMPDMLPLGKD